MAGPAALVALTALPLGTPRTPAAVSDPAALAHEHHNVSEIDPGKPIDWVMYVHVSSALRRAPCATLTTR